MRPDCADVSYQECSDIELARLVVSEDSFAFDELVKRYMPVIRKKAAALHAHGLETDDFIQEGLVGLLFSAKSFEESVGTKFSTYISVCIDRRFSSVCKNAGRKKHFPLNSSLSLSDDIFDAPSVENDPIDKIINTEEINTIKSRMKAALSKTESRVFYYHLGGYSYFEISNKLGCTEKSVDNALQRVKKKLSLF